MTAAVLAEIPEYAALARQAVYDHSLEHVHAIAGAIRSWSLPTAAELSFVRERGAFRANEQLPLSALLHSYRLGHRTVWERLVHLLVGSDCILEATLALTSLTLAYTERISSSLAEGYTERQRQLLVQVDRDRRDLLDRILLGTVERQSDTVRLASTFALVPGGDYLVVVAAHAPSSHGPSGDALTRAADTLKRHFAQGVAQPFVVTRHAEVVSIAPLARIRPAALALLTRHTLGQLRTAGQDWSAGISTVCGGLAEVARGYAEAQFAIDLARETSDGVCALLELRVSDYVMARAPETALRMIPHGARQLLSSTHADDQVLVSTLLAYLRCDLAVSATAEILSVHPNTVSYRLRKLGQRLGRDLSHFADVVEVLTWTRLLKTNDRSL